MDNLAETKERVLSEQTLGAFATDELWKRIRRESLFIMLPISNRCNMRCRICGSQTEDGRFDFSEMRLEDVKYILERIGKNKKVCFTKGEPTLNEDIFEFIRLTNKFGNIPVLWTNGIRLADSDYTKRLIQSGIKKIYISLDSLSPLTSQYFTGERKHLNYKLAALKNLKKLNFNSVYLSTRIAKDVNIDEMEDILEFTITNNDFIKGVVFYGVTPIGWFNMPESCAVSSYDLVLFLEKATKGNLNRDYVFEFNKFRCHLNLLFHKFGMIFPHEENSIYAVINNKQALVEFIPLRELREINRYLAEKKYHILIKYLFRYKNLITGIRSFFKPATLEFEFYEDKGIQIELHSSEDQCLDLEIIQIVKQETNFKIFGYTLVPM